MTGKWALIGVVIDRAPIYLNDVNLWDYEWADLNEESVSVTHPEYPSQKHLMDIYEIKVDGDNIKFAAGEFSNCVWGFYKYTAS